MCLFALAYQFFPDCPVLVFANREESPGRPCTSPRLMAGATKTNWWLGGQDLTAGGTWLGVNRTGMIVAVTNRPQTHESSRLKSRGLLCRELLEQESLDAAEAEFSRQWQRESFAGFNLMLVSKERGLVISAEEELQIQPLEPGLHTVTNFDWNDPTDRRVQRMRSLMESFSLGSPTWEQWIPRAKTVCGLGNQAGGDAICYPCTEGWGTVSSSLIALPDDVRASRYFHAAGSPSDTPYDDYSDQLVSLLDGANP
ncbi:MAG: NRDE family protein [Planctomycetaceae bacterium]|nr:NRDE family protein [Planctomycetaceae bacterium]